jgi:deoxyuridine 5'-triphosphate nucleotidohydrolase
MRIIWLYSRMAYYLLRLKVPAELPAELREMYALAVNAHNQTIETTCHFDAGFNLICPADIRVEGSTSVKIDHGVRGAMDFYCAGAGLPVGYFLYPRSSTGTKTPLRLANSVGVIDAGYRGPYIAAFDNIRGELFTIEKHQKLVQLCAPNLTYPMRVELVDELDMNTLRGEGGFGSTGK